MKRAVSVFMLLTAAAVLIPACRQRQSGQHPQQTAAAERSQANLDITLSQEVEAAEATQHGPAPQDVEGPDVGHDPNANQRPEIDGQLPTEQVPGKANTQEEPPLLLDDEPPLLLDDEPPLLLSDGSFAPTGPVADNSRCHHCHLNYIDEDIAVVHANANIGCADCHGNCDEHIADESWASGGNGTPPEIMYTRQQVNPCCVECHPEDELGKLEHQDFLAGKAKEKYCTDCHGEHRLTERKCKWK